jgi:hypothetical protein
MNDKLYVCGDFNINNTRNSIYSYDGVLLKASTHDIYENGIPNPKITTIGNYNNKIYFAGGGRDQSEGLIIIILQVVISMG